MHGSNVPGERPPTSDAPHPSLEGVDAKRTVEVSRDGMFMIVRARTLDEIVGADKELLLATLAKEGVKTIIAPALNVSVQEFTTSPFFDHAIGADGIVESSDPGAEHDTSNMIVDTNGNIIPLPQGRWIADHHEGPRYGQDAACEQVKRKMVARGVEEFRDNGNVRMSVWCNRRPDEDCAMTSALAMLAQKCASDAELRSVLTSKLMEALVSAEGETDVYLGAPLEEDVPKSLRQVLKRIFVSIERLRCTFLQASADDMEKAFTEAYEEIQKYLVEGHSYTGIALKEDPGTLVQHHGWDYSFGVEADGRANVRKLSEHKLVVFKGPQADGGRQIYSVAYWKRSNFPMQKLYQLLNFAESRRKEESSVSIDRLCAEISGMCAGSSLGLLTFTPWGGAEGGGCIPAGSAFMGPEFVKLMNHIVPLLEQEAMRVSVNKQRNVYGSLIMQPVTD